MLFQWYRKFMSVRRKNVRVRYRNLTVRVVMWKIIVRETVETYDCSRKESLLDENFEC